MRWEEEPYRRVLYCLLGEMAEAWLIDGTFITNILYRNPSPDLGLCNSRLWKARPEMMTRILEERLYCTVCNVCMYRTPPRNVHNYQPTRLIPLEATYQGAHPIWTHFQSITLFPRNGERDLPCLCLWREAMPSVQLSRIS